MYTGPYNQGAKNSCGAATLVIAAHQLNKLPASTDLGTEIAKVYGVISDAVLTKITLPGATPDQYVTPPANIIKKATDYKLTATPYITKDLDLAKIDKGDLLKGMKAGYIDTTHPVPADTKTLLSKLSKTSFLLLLVYLDEDIKQTHWVLMQEDDMGTPFIYDTAFASNQPASIADITFNGQFTTGSKGASRKNNFLGYAILLQ